jgi:hypothetical protein
MPKLPEQAPEERLEVLRAQLETAEHAASDVPEEASDEDKAAAEAHRADAEAALAQAHLEENKRAELAAQELRDLEKAAEVMGLQDLIQAGTTQNVRGTDALTPEEHARRRNPRNT